MAINKKIVLGVAPTKRDDPGFAVAKALENKVPFYKKLDEMGIEYIDIEDVCPNGLLVTMDDVDAAEKKFREAGVNALFIPSATFGGEAVTAFLAQRMNMPTLIWGPRDPKGNLTNGKTQIGVFPTGKALNLLNVKFTYIPTCYLDDPLFERGVRTFLRAARIVNAFRGMRILQVGTRPESFWSCIVNENEMLNRFGIYTYPIEVSELVRKTKYYLENEKERVDQMVEEIKARADFFCIEPVLYKSAAMKLALNDYVKLSRADGVAIQCWHDMQQEIGIWPCTAGSLLMEEGIPVACETDFMGAVSEVLAAAALDEGEYPFFADFINRHPTNNNAEMGAHCGMIPFGMLSDRPNIAKRLPPHDQNWGGGVTGHIKKSDQMTFMRIDQDKGQYKMLLGSAKAVDGPDSFQPNVISWFEVENWPKLEHKLVTGPYTHHVVITYQDIMPALYEAAKYIDGIEPDFAFKSDEEYAESYFYTE